MTLAKLGYWIAALWMLCGPVHGKENCEVPRADYVKSCGNNLECLNSNFHKIEKEIASHLRVRVSQKTRNAAMLQKAYEIEARYRKAFCRAILIGFEESWREIGAGPPAEMSHARKMIAATCNVKLLADFLYGLQGGLYCYEE